MSKKPLTILGILIVLAITGYFIYTAFATSNPHTWTNGLVGYWSFDGQYTTSTAGTRDVSNNGNWGAFNGGVKPVAGISGQALSFDGVDDYIQINNLDIAASGALSIELYFKANNVTPLQYLFVRAGTEVELIIQSGDLKFDIHDTGWKSISSAVSTGTWYHAIGTWDGTNMSLYMNGVEINTIAAGAPDASQTTNDIGYYSFSSTGPFNGLIDEVRIYSRALGADEIKQHYDQTRRNLKINQPSGTPPVGWWKMDEPTGATVRDYSVNVNNGTVSNGGYGATSTDGKIGKALSFDRVNDYVSVADANILSFGDGVADIPFTMSAWVKMVDATSFLILGKIDGSVREYNFGMTSADQLHCQIYDANNANYHYIYSTATFGAYENQWIYVVVTYNGSGLNTGLNIYFNATNMASTRTTAGSYTAMHNTATNLWIGGTKYATPVYCNGLIDDARIYNYARTADQIVADYRAGAYRTIVGTSVPSTWWTDGLVGYWNFDGQNTTSTNGTRGVSTSTNLWGAFSGGVKPIGGIVGQALSFDGVDDYVDAGSGAGLPLDDNTFTVEAWVKTSSQTRGGIVTRWTTPPEIVNWFLELNNTQYARFGIFNTVGSLYADAVGSTNLADGSWHHIVGVWEVDTKAELFVDGVSVNSTTSFTGLRSTQTPNLNIGKHVDAKFNGLIDEVRIYNRALSADEVMQHYQQIRRNLTL